MKRNVFVCASVCVGLACAAVSARAFELTFAADGPNGLPVYGQLGFTPSGSPTTTIFTRGDRTVTIVEGLTTGVAFFVVQEGDRPSVVWGQREQAGYRLESFLFNDGHSQSTLMLGGLVV